MLREEAIRIFRKEIECMSHTKCSDCILEKVCDPISTTPLDSEYIEAFGMAIEALSAEPCEDAISRADTIEWLKRVTVTDGITFETGFKQILTDIQNMPSVTPKPKMGWIPVSERLPEDGQNVLFCDIDGDIMVGYHVEGRPNTHFSQDGTFEGMKNVMAWMPLPEPYWESEDK